MNRESAPPIKIFLPTAIVFAVIGWGGVIWLLNFTLPTVGPRWLFFLFWFLALTGTALPVIAFLHRRFPSTPPATSTVITRQSIWIGLYGSALAWLQISRVVTPALGMLLAAGLLLVEWFLRLRERSQWKP